MNSTGKCTRCGQERQVVLVFVARPRGHTGYVPSSLSFDTPASTAEAVCSNCLTDEEILHRLAPTIEFALGVLLETINPELLNEQMSARVALEMVRTFFFTRRNEDFPPRREALRALGFSSEETP